MRSAGSLLLALCSLLRLSLFAFRVRLTMTLAGLQALPLILLIPTDAARCPLEFVILSGVRRSRTQSKDRYPSIEAHPHCLLISSCLPDQGL